MKVDIEFCKELINSNKPRGSIAKMLYKILGEEENFEVYCRLLFPEAFNKPFADFHKEIIADFMKKGNKAVAAPRGHGKTTLLGLGFVSWLIAYKKDKYVIYGSQNHQKSVQFIEPLIVELKHNNLFKFIYGLQRLSGVQEEGRDRQDMFDVNGIRVHALSFEKNIRGLKYGSSRPTRIILDDIEDDIRVLNPELRRKDENKLNKQIIPSLDAEIGVVNMIGTVLHHDSLLVKKVRLFGGRIYKACNFSDGVISGPFLFNDLYDEQTLFEIKKDIGSTSFQSEYLNEPIDDTASLIKRDWVRACFDYNLSFKEAIIQKYDLKIQGVDFAFGDRVTADKSAFVGVGKTADEYVILQCITKRGLSTTEQFDYINKLSGQYGYADNALEENSIQSMSKELTKEDSVWAFPFTLFWTAPSDPKTSKPSSLDTEYEGKRHTIGKVAMIKRLATQFENKRIRIPYKEETDKLVAEQLLAECTTYALADGKLVEVGVHGDIPIALGYAIERCEMERFDFEFGMLEV